MKYLAQMTLRAHLYTRHRGMGLRQGPSATSSIPCVESQKEKVPETVVCTQFGTQQFPSVSCGSKYKSLGHSCNFASYFVLLVAVNSKYWISKGKTIHILRDEDKLHSNSYMKISYGFLYI